MSKGVVKAQGDRVLNQSVGPVSKLEWVTEVIGACLQVVEDQTLKDLHHNRSKSNWTKVIQLRSFCLFRNRDNNR